MKLLGYLSIQSGEDLDAAVSKIKREMRHLNFIVMQKPHKLGGNFKVLQLISRYDATNFLKIDGPGFIIDELYNYFLTR